MGSKEKDMALEGSALVRNPSKKVYVKEVSFIRIFYKQDNARKSLYLERDDAPLIDFADGAPLLLKEDVPADEEGNKIHVKDVTSVAVFWKENMPAPDGSEVTQLYDADFIFRNVPAPAPQKSSGGGGCSLGFAPLGLLLLGLPLVVLKR